MAQAPDEYGVVLAQVCAGKIEGKLARIDPGQVHAALSERSEDLFLLDAYPRAQEPDLGRWVRHSHLLSPVFFDFWRKVQLKRVNAHDFELCAAVGAD